MVVLLVALVLVVQQPSLASTAAVDPDFLLSTAKFYRLYAVPLQLLRPVLRVRRLLANGLRCCRQTSAICNPSTTASALTVAITWIAARVRIRLMTDPVVRQREHGKIARSTQMQLSTGDKKERNSFTDSSKIAT